MRAVGLMTHGGPEVLDVVDVPEAHAGPGQVRIKVFAAAVNPTDTMARNGSRAEQQKADPRLIFLVWTRPGLSTRSAKMWRPA